MPSRPEERPAPRKPDYNSSFFIFPVLLPLAELLPLLLAGIGMLAGFAHVVSKKLLQRPVRLALACISIALLAYGGWLGWQRWGTGPSEEEGSVLLAAADLPKLETLGPLPKALPAPPTGQTALLWSTASSRYHLGKPLLKDGLILVGTYQGTFDAIDAATGKPVWLLRKGEPVFTAPSVQQGAVYIGEGHHTSPTATLTKLKFPEGTPLWSRRFASHVESYPIFSADGKTLFMSGGGTGLWALDAETGDVRWRQKLGHSDVPPMLVDDTLYFITQLDDTVNGAMLVALQPETGEILRRAPLEGNPMCSLFTGPEESIVLGTAYGQVGMSRGTDTGWAHGVAPTGKLRWTTKLPAMPLPESVMLKDKSLVFYTLADGQIMALRTQDGSVAWQARPGAGFQTDATLIEDSSPPQLAAVTMEGLVTIRNALTGEELRRLQVEQGASYALYGQGILYIVSPYSIRAYSGFGGGA